MDRKLEGDDLALEKEAGQRGVRVLPFFRTCYYGRTAGTRLPLEMALIGSVV